MRVNDDWERHWWSLRTENGGSMARSHFMLLVQLVETMSRERSLRPAVHKSWLRSNLYAWKFMAFRASLRAPMFRVKPCFSYLILGLVHLSLY